MYRGVRCIEREAVGLFIASYLLIHLSPVFRFLGRPVNQSIGGSTGGTSTGFCGVDGGPY